jgi:cytochrome c oxidase cbb3-type subunit 3
MMRKTIYGASGLVALIAAVAFTVHRADAALLRHDPDTLAGDGSLMRYAIARGAPIYRARCASCHGANGGGDATRGIPNLADGEWLYGSGLLSDIERVVAYGIRANHPKSWNLAIMPAFARARPSPTDPNMPPLRPAAIRDVIEYLMYLQQRPANPDAVARGAQVYSNTGGCYDCHSADAKGDPAIGAPNLTDRATLYGDGSREALHDSIAHGRQGVCPAWINSLSAAAVREVAVYVYSLSHSSQSNPPQTKHPG